MVCLWSVGGVVCGSNHTEASLLITDTHPVRVVAVLMGWRTASATGDFVVGEPGVGEARMLRVDPGPAARQELAQDKLYRPGHA